MRERMGEDGGGMKRRRGEEMVNASCFYFVQEFKKKEKTLGSQRIAHPHTSCNMHSPSPHVHVIVHNDMDQVEREPRHPQVKMKLHGSQPFQFALKSRKLIHLATKLNRSGLSKCNGRFTNHECRSKGHNDMAPHRVQEKHVRRMHGPNMLIADPIIWTPKTRHRFYVQSTGLPSYAFQFPYVQSTGLPSYAFQFPVIIDETQDKEYHIAKGRVRYEIVNQFVSMMVDWAKGMNGISKRADKGFVLLDRFGQRADMCICFQEA
jgi:hypothetical protein